MHDIPKYNFYKNLSTQIYYGFKFWLHDAILTFKILNEVMYTMPIICRLDGVVDKHKVTQIFQTLRAFVISDFF
jgi:hypothetical protein